jgi:hypothetical protein
MIKIFVPTKIADHRYDICKSCDKLTFIKTCSVCKCFMPLKTKLDNVACPLKKWGSANNTWGGK